MGPKFLSDLPHKPLEWELADQQLGALLLLPDLSLQHHCRPESVGFFTPPVARADFQTALVARLHAKAYASGRLSGSQLGERH
ncbi:hypothetical protein D8674_028928 [Pyrus ussuriensis x Pyrus communis]|uniref:Uncharacterized protein n=1 Tax=Pyrus ussuriensis x Pyrus communis TaxID=2448454 RepID=A0A5N5I2G4_9ROSA|nr:hypothetical protein D8674_028928 [Pyrus ussuriensis x Pyrus communis]